MMGIRCIDGCESLCLLAPCVRQMLALRPIGISPARRAVGHDRSLYQLLVDERHAWPATGRAIGPAKCMPCAACCASMASRCDSWGCRAEVPQTASKSRSKSGPLKPSITFRRADVDLTVTFTSPLLVDDLDLLSRPASYVTFDAFAPMANRTRCELYFDATAEWAVNGPDQQVAWRRGNVDGLGRDESRHRRSAHAGDQGRQRADRLGVSLCGRAARHGAHASIAADKVARAAFAATRGPPRSTTPRCRAPPTIAGRCCRSCSTWATSRVDAVRGGI